MNLKKFVWFYLPLVLYAGLIFFMSSKSLSGVPVPTFAYADKLMHMAEFFVLTFLLLRLFYNSKYREYSFYIAIIISVLYGLIDELHQHFVPGRSTDVIDFLSDSAGAFLVLVFAIRIRIMQKLLLLGGSNTRRKR